ncbi:glycoside hydrolase family 88 protein [Pontibacter sp. G13]|uniref:glycoside hydrolase family 88 protein n=1 Tax=Pontibacter sp. G13 TaxID=3074898 RepID=UPI002889A80F|nr:glycoside hydrolase family 88 protein [Pontibacter sp. G13]WNJ17562.1 glycoside hydrolase family 88 protein [Pontibacter sp. G13]
MRSITTSLIIWLAALSFSQAQVKLSPYEKHPSVAHIPYSLLDEYAYQDQAIKQTIRKVAEFQINKYGPNIPVKNWLVGTFYSSLVGTYQVTGEEWYLDQAYAWGKRSEWDIHDPMHADDVCPGQTYLDLYEVKQEAEMLTNLESKLAAYFTQQEFTFRGRGNSQPKALTGRNLWHWCDALYMAPPVFARMSQATGDPKYREKMHELYWDAVDFLYSDEDQLFHRNSKAQSENDRTPNGKKIFWGRGNGWVIAGLARLIDYLPADDPMRPKYVTLFQDLAFSLARYQMEDGLWRASVNDPAWLPSKETSASSFYVYAMAKGINAGWLPREYFAPVVLKGWSGLMASVTPSGKLGYSQNVAGQPFEVRPQDNKDYAAGAFILAGAEMLKMNASQQLANLTQRSFEPRLVAKDGAWTWYNDERVIFHKGIFYASYVKRDGKSAFTAFGLESMGAVHAQREVILSTWNWSDDHNNAAFLPLKNDHILACYATHGKSKHFYQREISVARWKPAVPGEERSFEMINTRKGLTYQNLHRLSDEGDRIYNFFRGNNFNPNFVYSEDEAETWSEPIWLISAGTKSNKRPYVKYISNGKDRIDFLYTDGHPRQMKQNNVYHFYYSKGAFYTSKGTLIRTMEALKTDPIRPEEGTMIFDGSTDSGRGWVHDLEYDEEGNPHAAFISSPSGDMGTDMRYWTATFNGRKWKKEEIGFAGSNLYPKEQHYAGGIALYPANGNTVIISADVHPSTGEPLPKRRYQLFKGVKKGKSWNWEQLTFDPVFDHLRPVIVRGERNALFWFTGDYRTFLNYHTDVMMSYEF